MKVTWLPFPILVILGLIGCGKGPELPPVVPVKGKVTVNEKPFPDATVIFTPTGSTPGSASTGRTDAEGLYELKSGNRPGTSVGTYKVVISKRVMPDGTPVPPDDPTPPMESKASEYLPAQFSDFNRTKLTAKVPEGGATINFPLKK